MENSYLPVFTIVVGPLDQHGRWSECFEGDDQVGEVELGLEVQSDGHVLDAVLRLPPRPVPLRARVPKSQYYFVDQIFFSGWQNENSPWRISVHNVVDFVVVCGVLRLRVTPEALFTVF